MTEANANRYTFVWRGTLNYHLAGLLDTIDGLYKKYNAFLEEHGYGPKYDLGNAHMFIIEGMGLFAVRERKKRRPSNFGDIKENENFRRFNYRTTEKVYKEFMLYAIGRNINKYHRFLHNKIQKFEGKTEQKTA